MPLARDAEIDGCTRAAPRPYSRLGDGDGIAQSAAVLGCDLQLRASTAPRLCTAPRCCTAQLPRREDERTAQRMTDHSHKNASHRHTRQTHQALGAASRPILRTPGMPGLSSHHEAELSGAPLQGDANHTPTIRHTTTNHAMETHKTHRDEASIGSEDGRAGHARMSQDIAPGWGNDAND